jgi:hypothetical protein
MRENNDLPASAFLTGMGRHIIGGIAALLLSIVIGCASAPKPVTIRHESTPSQSDAAMTRQQPRKEPGEQLKQKSANQPDEAAAAFAPPASLSTEGTGTTAIEEARAAQEANERELIEKITAQVTEEVRKNVEEEVRRDVTNELLRQIWTINNALKEKDKRLRFGGDIRLRYEQVRFDKNNYPFLPKISQGAYLLEVQNTWANQDFFKYRVRFGAEAKVNDETDAVLRLSTGSTSNPVSTNTTMGDYMNKDSVLFDLAYLKWQPWKSFTFYGGRMPNPWFSSDLVWDNDLSFEGFAMQARTATSGSWTPFFATGAFPLQQSDPVSTIDFSQKSKWLYAGQIGVERKNQKGVSAKIGAAYYGFKNITGVENPDPTGYPGATDWSAPLFQQRGNALFLIDRTNSLKEGLASEFKELNITGTLDIGYWDPVHIVLLGDYVENLGFKQSDVAQRVPDPDYPNTSTGYQIGMSVGYPKIENSGQWKVSFHYKYLEADAVVDAFTDSDFHLGGTNAKGWILGTEFGLMKNTWLTLRWLTSDEISGPPMAIDVLQVDINARF